MNLLFISDLHLHPTRPNITRAFYSFLELRARKCSALYILGDFFDSWIGDDDDDALGIEVSKKLKALSKNHVKIYIMHGNRDFLMGRKFAKKSGATLIDDPYTLTINGIETVLLHGDSLCTEDAEYMAMRKEFRSEAWQKNILAQPLSARRAFANKLRIESQAMNDLKDLSIMDVTTSSVIATMRKFKANLMIHGHTHRPTRHLLSLDGSRSERIVLGDWEDKAWCLSVDNEKIELESWDIEKASD